MCSKKTETPGKLEDIDENLRQAYQDLLNEALPDRFTTLLEQLRHGALPSESVNGNGSGQ